MPNIELSISPEYVNGWAFRDALRELYQNCMDQETVDPENALLWNYNPSTLVLKIGNRKSTLSTSSLVLGTSTKRKDERLVGQFGEGYKLALIVLLRLGKTVVIYNKPNVWTPSIKHSDTFETSVLNIHTVKYRFKDLPEQDLIFEIRGVTPEEVADYMDKNLHFHCFDEERVLEHTYGRILCGEKYKGNIYVNGLYVTHLKDADYGYDIHPAYLNIGRDRDLVNSWDVFYRTSAMWAAQSEAPEIVEALIEKKSPDINYLSSYVYNMPKHTVDYISGRWYNCHGCHAVPVSSEEGAQKARSMYGNEVKVVMVTEQMLAVLKQAPQFKALTKSQLEEDTPKAILQRLLDHPDKDRYKKAVRDELEVIVEMAAHWRWKTN